MNDFLDYGLLLQGVTTATENSTVTEIGVVDGEVQPLGQGGFLSNPMFLILIPLLLVMMFTMGGGNRKRQKQMQAMLNSLEKGDKVQSIGGIIGTVAHVKEGSVVLKVDENTKMEFATSAVQMIVQKKNPPPTPVASKGLFSGLKDKIGGAKKGGNDAKTVCSSASPDLDKKSSAGAGSEKK